MVTVMLVRVVTVIGGGEVTVRVFNGVCYKGVCRKVTNPYAVVTLFDSDWLLWILMIFH